MKAVYPMIYTVEIFDSEYMDEIEHVSGITFAKTLCEAMEKIERYYGDIISEIKVNILEEGDILEFPKNAISDAILHEEF